jgi:hypothetical protein
VFLIFEQKLSPSKPDRGVATKVNAHRIKRLVTALQHEDWIDIPVDEAMRITLIGMFCFVDTVGAGKEPPEAVLRWALHGVDQSRGDSAVDQAPEVRDLGDGDRTTAILTGCLNQINVYEELSEYLGHAVLKESEHIPGGSTDRYSIAGLLRERRSISDHDHDAANMSQIARCAAVAAQGGLEHSVQYVQDTIARLKLNTAVSRFLAEQDESEVDEDGDVNMDKDEDTESDHHGVSQDDERAAEADDEADNEEHDGQVEADFMDDEPKEDEEENADQDMDSDKSSDTVSIKDLPLGVWITSSAPPEHKEASSESSETDEEYNGGFLAKNKAQGSDSD